MISVVIPAYNRAGYLQDAVESVLNQTFQDFEIIVVDDSSTDNTKEVIAGYKDRVRYIFQDNKKQGAARNNGIMHAGGNYIAFLDSDDMWDPNHLEACFNALRHAPEAGLSFSGSYIIDEEGKIISKTKARYCNGFVLKNIISEFSAGGCNASSCLIRRDVFNNVGYFIEDRSLCGSEDWEMWARIAAFTKFVSTNVHTVKIRYHRQKSSLTVDSMARSMTKALDTVYANADILPKIKNIKGQAYSSLYTVIAIDCYASGNMVAARKYLKQAIVEYFPSLFFNKYVTYTLLRSLLGPGLSRRIREVRRMINTKLLNS